MIRLDATLKSNLNWAAEIEKAHKIAESGSKIEWELDFGLFEQVRYPLSHEQQFQSFCLGIEHFREVIWTVFSELTSNISFYQGPLDDIPFILFNHEQDTFQKWLKNYTAKSSEAFDVRENTFLKSLFCRDIALDFLKQLASQMPFGSNPNIKPKLIQSFSPIEQAIFFHEELYKPFELEINRSAERIAICLPAVSQYCNESIRLLDEAFLALDQKAVPFHIVTEEALIMNLSGLDALVVSTLAISSQGKRKLMGFCAAGGTILTVGGDHLQLPQEMPFHEWLAK